MGKEEIVFLNKGLPRTMKSNGEFFHSGIWKEPANELEVRFQKISGDDIANHKYHGGSERVVCLYPFEHYAYWERQFGKPLSRSAFGENLTVTNMKEDQICIGDIFQIGEAVLQVSQGRYPCVTINKWNSNDRLLDKIIETGFTGYFFRVLKEGEILSDSKIKKLSFHPKEISVASIHHLYFHNSSPTKDSIQNILKVEELAMPWRLKLQELLDRLN